MFKRPVRTVWGSPVRQNSAAASQVQPEQGEPSVAPGQWSARPPRANAAAACAVTVLQALACCALIFSMGGHRSDVAWLARAFPFLIVVLFFRTVVGLLSVALSPKEGGWAWPAVGLWIILLEPKKVSYMDGGVLCESLVAILTSYLTVSSRLASHWLRFLALRSVTIITFALMLLGIKPGIKLIKLVIVLGAMLFLITLPQDRFLWRCLFKTAQHYGWTGTRLTCAHAATTQLVGVADLAVSCLSALPFFSSYFEVDPIVVAPYFVIFAGPPLSALCCTLLVNLFPWAVCALDWACLKSSLLILVLNRSARFVAYSSTSGTITAPTSSAAIHALPSCGLD